MNKTKGATKYRSVSTLEDVDAVQRLHFPDGTATHRNAGRDGVMCRTTYCKVYASLI